MWWSQNYGGDYTDSGMWTKEAINGYILWGSLFTVIGILGVIGGFIIWFKGLPAVAQDNKAYLRKILLPIGIIGILAGAIIGGVMIIFVWLMYSNDRYDFFGLLLEDVTRAKRRGPTPVGAGAAAPADTRDAYAQGYQEQQGLYSEDYAQAAYGGGEGAYSAGQNVSLVDTQKVEPEPAPAPAEGPKAAPACKSCGKPTEWIEQYGRYYCYDCDAYI